MKAIKMFLSLAAAVVLFVNMSLFAQAKPDTTMPSHKMMKHDQQKMQGMMHDSTKMHGKMMMKDSSHHMMNNKKMKGEEMSSIVRKGEIDLKAIDKNKDGKVFQDMMDWNVISDTAGECPLCGMTLKEVTIDKAKENLMKHHFKVKGASEKK